MNLTAARLRAGCEPAHLLSRPMKPTAGSRHYQTALYGGPGSEFVSTRFRSGIANWDYGYAMYVVRSCQDRRRGTLHQLRSGAAPGDGNADHDTGDAVSSACQSPVR